MTAARPRLDMTVRPVLPAEYSAVADLTVTVYADVLGSVVSDEYRAELADVARRARDAVVLVAVDGAGRLLGSVTYVPGPGPYAEFDGEDEAGIRMLVVDPEVQRQGVGTALVQASLEHALAAGRRRVVLHTVEQMAAAVRLYEGLGFLRDRRRDILLDSGVRLLAYSREL